MHNAAQADGADVTAKAGAAANRKGQNKNQNADAKAQGVKDKAKVKREEEEDGESLEAIDDSWEDSEPVELETIGEPAGEEIAELAADEW